MAVAIVAAAGARMTGASAAEVAQAGWLVALQLWFLPVYRLLIVLTPVMLTAHQRWGLAVPAVMAAATAAVDLGVIGARLPLIGYANYLLVWGSMHQWGFAWRDGILTRARWRPYALAAGGAALLGALLTLPSAAASPARCSPAVRHPQTSAVAPPNREPVPEAPTPPNGATASSLTVWSWICTMPLGIRSASASALGTSAPRMPGDSPYSVLRGSSTAGPDAPSA